MKKRKPFITLQLKSFSLVWCTRIKFVNSSCMAIKPFTAQSRRKMRRISMVHSLYRNIYSVTHLSSLISASSFNYADVNFISYVEHYIHFFFWFDFCWVFVQIQGSIKTTFTLLVIVKRIKIVKEDQERCRSEAIKGKENIHFFLSVIQTHSYLYLFHSRIE